MTQKFKVFVYGTLKPNYSNYNSLNIKERSIKEKPGYVKGKLIDLGSFPGLVKGNNKIFGVIIYFNDSKLLKDMDMLEGFKLPNSPSNLYNREEVCVYDEENDKVISRAYIYFLNLCFSKYKEIQSGIW